MTEGLQERLARLDSCALSDGLDVLGLPGAVTSLQGITLPGRPVVGRVRTVEAGPVEGEGPHAHIAAGLVDITEPGDVIVIANGGRTDVSCWGGLLGKAAVRRSVAGVIVDGAFRDVDENAQLGLPVYARCAVPVSARRRVVQKAMDDRVDIAGVVVDSGDWVVADSSGVVFVRGIDAEQVVDLAERIVAREQRMLTAVSHGEPVNEVMHDSKFASITA